MIEFHDYDPAHPFPVASEQHIIQDSKITLDYVPLKYSITIEGFRENTTGSPQMGEYYVEYGDADNYRSADQVVHFPDGYDGLMVAVAYQGVSTILRATHMNEIKTFMENGASELAARIIVLHEEAMMETWKEIFSEHCNHICHALNDIRAAIGSESIGSDNIADDEEADEMMDEFIPGDVPATPKTAAVADDEEVEEILDELFPTPTSGEENTPSENLDDKVDDDS